MLGKCITGVSCDGAQLPLHERQGGDSFAFSGDRQDFAVEKREIRFERLPVRLEHCFVFRAIGELFVLLQAVPDLPFKVLESFFQLGHLGIARAGDMGVGIDSETLEVAVELTQDLDADKRVVADIRDALQGRHGGCVANDSNSEDGSEGASNQDPEAFGDRQAVHLVLPVGEWARVVCVLACDGWGATIFLRCTSLFLVLG